MSGYGEDIPDDPVAREFSASLQQVDPCRGCERKWFSETDFCTNHCREYVRYLVSIMVDLKCSELQRSINAIQNSRPVAGKALPVNWHED